MTGRNGAGSNSRATAAEPGTGLTGEADNRANTANHRPAQTRCVMDADPEEVRRFVETVIGAAKSALAGADAGDGRLQVVRRFNEDTVPVRYRIDDVDAIVEAAISGSERRRNIYIEGRLVPADLEPGRRGKIADTLAVFALVADADADKNLSWVPTLQPSMTVETSPNNRHYWYFLTTAVNGEQGRALGQRLRAASTADRDTGNITQPYRVAGTPNFPSDVKIARGRTETPTRILEISGRSYTVQQFEAAFPPVKKQRGERGRRRRSAAGGDGSTSGVFHKLVCDRTERGLTVEQIEDDYRANPHKWAGTKAAMFDQKGVLREEIERSAGKAEGPTGEEKKKTVRLPYVDLTAPLTPRLWIIKDRIPGENVTLLSGEGGGGKSVLAMQLAAAVVLERPWLGMMPEARGPVLYVSCEDDEAELRRRFQDVAQHYESTRGGMDAKGLGVICLVGQDAALAIHDRDGWMDPTPLFTALRKEAVRLEPKLIILDTAADVFAGKEIDRVHVTQFITLLRRLAIDAGAGVLLISHPSVAGKESGSGISGSTAWHNRVRARIYLDTPADKKAQGGNGDNGVREIEFRKNNYGPLGEMMRVRWVDGVFVVAGPADEKEQLATQADAEDLFMTLLRRFTEAGRNVTEKKGTSYAPALFADEAEAQKAGLSKKDLCGAMNRLFASKEIRMVEEGPPSKRRSRIVEVM